MNIPNKKIHVVRFSSTLFTRLWVSEGKTEIDGIQILKAKFVCTSPFSLGDIYELAVFAS